jgi:hypothetical protein
MIRVQGEPMTPHLVGKRRGQKGTNPMANLLHESCQNMLMSARCLDFISIWWRVVDEASLSSPNSPGKESEEVNMKRADDNGRKKPALVALKLPLLYAAKVQPETASSTGVRLSAQCSI